MSSLQWRPALGALIWSPSRNPEISAAARELEQEEVIPQFSTKWIIIIPKRNGVCHKAICGYSKIIFLIHLYGRIKQTDSPAHSCVCSSVCRLVFMIEICSFLNYHRIVFTFWYFLEYCSEKVQRHITRHFCNHSRQLNPSLFYIYPGVLGKRVNWNELKPPNRLPDLKVEPCRLVSVCVEATCS